MAEGLSITTEAPTEATPVQLLENSRDQRMQRLREAAARGDFSAIDEILYASDIKFYAREN